MPKKKMKALEVPAPDPVVMTEVPVVQEVVFPRAGTRAARCPKCGGLATRSASARRKDGVQHRKCLRPSCREAYKVPGTAV